MGGNYILPGGGGNFMPPQTSKRTPKKPTQIRVDNSYLPLIKLFAIFQLLFTVNGKI